MGENETLGKLSLRQRRFIAALIAAPTVRSAAAQAGIAESSAWRYLGDPSVKAALAERQDSVLAHVSRRLGEEMGVALLVLSIIMRDKRASDGARVSAARAILDSGLRLYEIVSLGDRVAALEQRMTEAK